MANELLSGQPLAQQAPPLTVHAGYDSYLDRIAQIESGGDPTRVNPTSGAAGLYQFMPGTWRQYGEGSPMDPAAARAGALRLTQANAAVLTRALGRAPTEAELYLAHQQGAEGAAKLLANPGARAGDIVGDKAVAGNGGDPNAPASAFTAQWTARYAGAKPMKTIPGATPPLDAALQPPPAGEQDADFPEEKRRAAAAKPGTPGPQAAAAPAVLTPPPPSQPLISRSPKEWYLGLLKQPTEGPASG